MSKKKWGWIAVVALALVLNITFLGRRFWFSPLSVADRRENQEISDAFRDQAMARKGEEIDMIGNLVRGETWIALQLTERQKFALRELSDLINEARILSLKAEAEPYNGAPARRRNDIARRNKNRVLAIVQARHLVTAGLLTEEQAAYMVQHYLSGPGWNSVYEGSVQDLIAVTPSQETQLLRLGDDLRTGAIRTIMPVAFSRGKDAQESYKKFVNDALGRQDLAVRKILTPVQLERWGRLAATRPPPAAPPDSKRPSPSDAEEAAVVIEDVSLTFRAWPTARMPWVSTRIRLNC